jgi:hypothetical protein
MGAEDNVGVTMSKVRTRIIVLCLALGASSCGSPDQFATPTVLMATISGHVRQFDCSGPRTINCPSHPAMGIEIDFTAGAASGVAVTDANGAYAIELASGTYQVHLKVSNSPLSGPTSMKVSAGQSIKADYTY